jgi:hypothetical protein
MLMSHPNLPASPPVEVPETAFRDVWRHRDWVEFSEDAPAVEDMTVPEAVKAVGDDPAKARAALRAEKTGRDRATLTSQLEQIAGQDTDKPAEES